MKSLWLALLLSTVGASVWAAEAPAKAGEEEAVDLDALDEPGDPPPKRTVTRVPEHDYDRRLIVFPLLLVAILAWNVKWKKDPAPARKAAPVTPPASKEGSQ